MAKVSLLVDGQIFSANKDVLCEHSDYFRAMFSGNYLENDKEEISIEALNAEYMKMTLEYISTGSLDLTESSLSTIGELASTAIFLQITQLLLEIEGTLRSRELSPENWADIMIIAKNSLFTELEHQCAIYGLHMFKSVRPEYIPDLTTPCWYLSHPFLEAESELDVFKFGYTWVVLRTEESEEALLVVLGCLDIKKVTLSTLSKIIFTLSQNTENLATEIVEYLHTLTEIGCSTTTALTQNKTTLKGFRSERVYNETLHLVTESRSRRPTPYTLLVPLTKNYYKSLHYYTLTGNGLIKWLEYPDEYIRCCLDRLPRWMYSSQGWSIVAWGLTKMVVSSSIGNFHCLKVYDTLKKEWANYDPGEHEKPPVNVVENYAHIIIGDLLYLVSSIERTISTKTYDLKNRTYTRLSGGIETDYTKEVEVAEWSKDKPAVCVHDGTLYAAAHKHIYKCQHRGHLVGWRAVATTGIRVKSMTSFNGYIYCTQYHTNMLYYFRPDVSDRLCVVTRLANPPVSMYNLGNRLLFLTTPTRENRDIMNVEEYYGISPEEKPKVVWREKITHIQMKEIDYGCSLVLTAPPLHSDISTYAKEHLKKFCHTTKNFCPVTSVACTQIGGLS